MLPRNRQSPSSPVPVRSRVGEQGWEDEGEDDLDVLAHQGNDIWVVPVIQRSFGDLLIRRNISLYVSRLETPLSKHVPGSADC
jgi:hypothetical protein